MTFKLKKYIIILWLNLEQIIFLIPEMRDFDKM